MTGKLIAGLTGALALAGLAAGCGGSGSPGYTRTSNPCVTSRLANGEWQSAGIPRAAAAGEAATLCGYGASFNTTAAPAFGVGRNTSGWTP